MSTCSTPTDTNALLAAEFAAASRRGWLINLLRTSTFPVPQVRRAALRESIRAAPDDRTVTDIFFDAVCGSPYVPDSAKTQLAEVFLSGRWSTDLPTAARCESTALGAGNDDASRGLDGDCAFRDFRSMAIGIFSKSRKVARLPDSEKRRLGTAILSTANRQELVDLMVCSLETARTLDHEARAKIANDVFEERFYNLLLPDRFDCDESPRQTGEVEEAGQGFEQDQYARPSAPVIEELDGWGDCPICLGTSPPSNSDRLPCGHAFCEGCTLDWVARHGNPFPCPMCRASCRRLDGLYEYAS